MKKNKPNSQQIGRDRGRLVGSTTSKKGIFFLCFDSKCAYFRQKITSDTSWGIFQVEAPTILKVVYFIQKGISETIFEGNVHFGM